MSVLKDTNTLSGFVRRVMENKGLTAREVERKSNKGISHSYVNKIKNGDATNPSPSQIQALAKGIDEPEEILFALVRGKKPDEKVIADERFAHILELYRNISPEERLLVEPWLDALTHTLERIGTNIYQEKAHIMTIHRSFVSTVRNLLKIIARDYGLIIENGDDSKYAKPFNPAFKHTIFFYFNNYLTGIILYRFLEYDTNEVEANISYYTDNDITKLEKDLRNGIDELLKQESQGIKKLSGNSENTQNNTDTLQNIDGRETTDRLPPVEFVESEPKESLVKNRKRAVKNKG